MVGRRPLEILRKWHQEHGPIVSFWYGTTPALSIGSYDIAHQLLNKRSSIYSSRPRFFIASEKMTNGLTTLLMPYGKKLQNQQRMITPMLDSRALRQYRTLEDMESKQTLVELLSAEDFDKSITRYAGSVIMSLAYGIRLQDMESEMPAKLLDLNTKIFEAMTSTYSNLVDLFPALNSLPPWLKPWEKPVQTAERFITDFHMENMATAQSSPWNWVQEAMASKPGSQISDKEIAYVIGTLQQGGFEITLAVVRLVIKAMVLFPNFLEKAQEELDRVVGPDRLPSFDDQAQLPYVNALITEALRWQPPAPVIPHATTEDDEYMGYRFSKGTVIIPNVTAMCRDPAVFPDPHRYNPERWLEDAGLQHNAFGFGRRTCPGGGLGMNMIFILVARVLWGYDVTYVYRDGKAVDVDPMGEKFPFASLTMPFQASLIVRGPEKREVIEREWAASGKDTNEILAGIGASRSG
ncbi:hypothetical protein FE257_004245 [Aspergillus nanangensis]|uniref:Cytochrome P450 n=1 Tax=Aspergillus nanangensis TaxID=2582783 RepID=A0AAD4GV70_ASPNN|nr:hypothetical protein FE257_004245 [Aspergillus nanangensis]